MCKNCSILYHLETLTIKTGAYPWMGESEIKKSYLVPKGMTLYPQKEKKEFNFEESVIAYNSKKEIIEIIKDMEENKYTTRLKNTRSKEIVYLHEGKCHGKNLKIIIPKLKKCLETYERYEWVKEKYIQYTEQEKKRNTTR